MFALKKATDRYIGKDISTRQIIFRQSVEATKLYVKERKLTNKEVEELKGKSLADGEAVDTNLLLWLFEDGKLTEKEISQLINKSLKWVKNISEVLKGENEELDLLNLSFEDMLNLTNVAYKHKSGEVLHQVDYDRETTLRNEAYRFLRGTEKLWIRQEDIDDLINIVDEAVKQRKIEEGK